MSISYDLVIAAKFIWQEFNSGHINILDFLSLADLERIKEGQRNNFMSYETWNNVPDNYISIYRHQRLCYYCYVNQDALIEMYGFPPHTNFEVFANQLIDMEIIKRTN